ncbi:nuclease-related domain-containing protein [Sporosarcina siberiensis]|uniref:Nuclease-related domain-containing protein n=1 Tax=Sporosarcina siberiensis TaxID=1365606 RepID=A0ABW4SD59_9BACL
MTNNSEREWLFIKKIQRKEPELLQSLPRLIARLNSNQSKTNSLQKQLYNVQAGFSGERYIDRYLESLEVPISLIVLTDIHLTLTPGNSFQIDTLILSDRFLLILDVKNIAGNLHFTTNPNQLEQTLSTGEETIMDCPLDQLKTHIYVLQVWLAKRGINVDILGRVIISSKSGRVKEAPENAPIIYRKGLPILLNEMAKLPVIYSQNQLSEISNVIKQSKVVFNPFPLCRHYDIDPTDLKRGQLCPNCFNSMIYKSHKQRQCTSCGLIEPNNYQESLKDWFILVNDSISNRECREFLQLNNKDDAYYALKTLHLNKTGNSVSTRYHWPSGKPFM